jgi:hypothetical protein
MLMLPTTLPYVTRIYINTAIKYGYHRNKETAIRPIYRYVIYSQGHNCDFGCYI